MDREPTKKDLQTVGAGVISRLHLKIFHELDTVVFEINGTQLKLDYMDAFRVATELRLQARQAKKWAGDSRKVIEMSALLTDGEENYRRNW